MPGSDDYYKQRADDAGDVVEVEHGDGPMRTRSETTDGGARIVMVGRPQQNEEGVRDVCMRLAEAIGRQTGEDWHADAERPRGPEDGVDWYLRSSRGGVWGVQVTRVGAADRWARSAGGERVTEELLTSDAAREIWEAIRKKIQIREGILALALGQPGAHAFRATLQELQRKGGRSMQEQVRVSEACLVGYSPETTVRIHPPEPTR
jgi:hypothetical protein